MLGNLTVIPFLFYSVQWVEPLPLLIEGQINPRLALPIPELADPKFCSAERPRLVWRVVIIIPVEHEYLIRRLLDLAGIAQVRQYRALITLTLLDLATQLRQYRHMAVQFLRHLLQPLRDQPLALHLALVLILYQPQMVHDHQIRALVGTHAPYRVRGVPLVVDHQ